MEEADAKVIAKVTNGSHPKSGTQATGRVELGNDSRLQALLRKFEDLRKTFQLPELAQHQEELELAIPIVAVVGHQSHGKSSLLSMLSGVSLPVKGGATVTTRPLHLKLRKGPIRKLLFQPHTGSRVEEIDEGQVETYIANAMLVDVNGQENDKIREDVMYLTVEGSPANIDLVDLPGMHAEEGCNAAEDIITKWVQNDAAIIIIVHSASDDVVNDKVYKIAKDERGDDLKLRDRTLCVLTKVDMLTESPKETKGRKLFQLLNTSTPFKRAGVIAHGNWTALKKQPPDYPEAEKEEQKGLAKLRSALDAEAAGAQRTIAEFHLGTAAVRTLIVDMYIDTALQQVQKLQDLLARRFQSTKAQQKQLEEGVTPAQRFQGHWQKFLLHVDNTIRSRDDQIESEVQNSNSKVVIFRECRRQLADLKLVPAKLLNEPDRKLVAYIKLLANEAGLPGTVNFNANNRLSRFNETQINTFLKPAVDKVCGVAETELLKALNISVSKIPDKACQEFILEAGKQVVQELAERINTRVTDIFQDQKESTHTTSDWMFTFLSNLGTDEARAKEHKIFDSFPASAAILGECKKEDAHLQPEEKAWNLKNLVEHFHTYCAYWLVMIHACMDAVSMCVRREMLSLHDRLSDYSVERITPEAIDIALRDDGQERARVQRTLSALEAAQNILNRAY